MAAYDPAKGIRGNLRWFMVGYISFIHIGAIIGLLYLQQCKWQTLLFTFLLWPISGIGITAGAHRLWSHRSYKAAFPVRVILLIFNSIANQGSIYHWSRDHRVHHKHSETDGDPHNAMRGFFFAHVGWLLVNKHQKVIEAGKKLNFDDLWADPLVRLQHNLDPWWNFTWCFIMPSVVPMVFWGENFWLGYWVAGVLRYTLVLHFTWCVNSAAHFWGDRPYDPKINPSENTFVSIVAVGEGWHNWHHKFPYDYAASEFGVSTQFNPSKMFIDFFAKLGLVWDRKRAHDAWEITKKQRAATAEPEKSNCPVANAAVPEGKVKAA